MIPRRCGLRGKDGCGCYSVVEIGMQIIIGFGGEEGVAKVFS